MMFRVERVMGIAMLCFGRERLIAVLCNSPLHPIEVAVVELATTKENFEGAICLDDLVQFAALLNLSAHDVYIREQSASTIEVWLFNRSRRSHDDFDEDPTPVDHLVDKKGKTEVQPPR